MSAPQTNPKAVRVLFDPGQQLSAPFTLGEFLVSRERPDLASALDPTLEQVVSLARLCSTLLEPIRAHAGAPLLITSGLRSRELNAAIGGSPTSQHLRGRAADFVVPGREHAYAWELFNWIFRESRLDYGQVIVYRLPDGAWKGNIHLSVPEPGVAHRALVFDPRARAHSQFLPAENYQP